MEKITSFTIDHTKLIEGLYVSRVDRFGGETITTFDLRMKKPNTGDVLTTTSAHTIEHLGATYLRNHKEFGAKTVYFGPMGCRTGFYAVLHGNYSSLDVAELMRGMFTFIVEYEGAVPGASAVECGNFRDLSLEEAKKDAAPYLAVLKSLTAENTVYPK